MIIKRYFNDNLKYFKFLNKNKDKIEIINVRFTRKSFVNPIKKKPNICLIYKKL